jgi:hypothetical protein
LRDAHHNRRHPYQGKYSRMNAMLFYWLPISWSLYVLVLRDETARLDLLYWNACLYPGSTPEAPR